MSTSFSSDWTAIGNCSPSDSYAQPVASSSHPPSSLERAWYNVKKTVGIPFLSGAAALQNKRKTGHCLTSGTVFSLTSGTQNDSCYKVNFFDKITNLETMKRDFQNRVRETPPFLFGIHIRVSKFVDHSALLVLGRDRKEIHFSLFLDVRGTPPGQINLSDQLDTDHRQENNSTVRTVFDLHCYLRHNLTPVLLFYSIEDIQPDRVLCAAYSAVVWDVLIKELTSNSSFNHENFIQNFANGEYTNFSKAYKLAGRISEVAAPVTSPSSSHDLSEQDVLDARSNKWTSVKRA